MKSTIENQLRLFRYRGNEDSEYFYFWVERQGDIDVYVSPMFANENEAHVWIAEINSRVKDICLKMRGEK